MAKLRHIALSVPDPWASARFYQEAFGLDLVGEAHSATADGVYLSDGTVSLTLLKYKTDAPRDPRAKILSVCTTWAFYAMTLKPKVARWRRPVLKSSWMPRHTPPPSITRKNTETPTG